MDVTEQGLDFLKTSNTCVGPSLKAPASLIPLQFLMDKAAVTAGRCPGGGISLADPHLLPHWWKRQKGFVQSLDSPEAAGV